MPRPRGRRRTRFTPNVTYYKPQGMPMRFLNVVELSIEEVEALRLKHVQGLRQVDCAKEMHTSQSTFQRILASAQKKLAKAVIEGCAIRICGDDASN